MGVVGWGGYQVASFPVVLGSTVIYLAAVGRNLEQSDGSHHLVGVSLSRGVGPHALSFCMTKCVVNLVHFSVGEASFCSCVIVHYKYRMLTISN